MARKAQHPAETTWARLGQALPVSTEARRVQRERQCAEVSATWGNFKSLLAHCARGMVLCSVLPYDALLGGMR